MTPFGNLAANSVQPVRRTKALNSSGTVLLSGLIEKPVTAEIANGVAAAAGSGVEEKAAAAFPRTGGADTKATRGGPWWGVGNGAALRLSFSASDLHVVHTFLRSIGDSLRCPSASLMPHKYGRQAGPGRAVEGLSVETWECSRERHLCPILYVDAVRPVALKQSKHVLNAAPLA